MTAKVVRFPILEPPRPRTFWQRVGDRLREDRTYRVPALVVLAVLVPLFLLLGCETAPSRVVTGEEVAAPWGHQDLCRREPWQPSCGGAK